MSNGAAWLDLWDARGDVSQVYERLGVCIRPGQLDLAEDVPLAIQGRIARRDDGPVLIQGADGTEAQARNGTDQEVPRRAEHGCEHASAKHGEQTNGWRGVQVDGGFPE